MGQLEMYIGLFHLIGVPPLWMIFRYLSAGVKKDKNLFIRGGGGGGGR